MVEPERRPNETPSAPSKRRALDRPFRWRRTLALIALLPAAFLLQWAASWAPDFVEAAYSRTLYPFIVGGLGVLTGWIPFSLAEVLVAACVLWFLVAALRAVIHVIRKRRRIGNALAHGAGKVLALTSVIYMAGVLLWGFNYHRVPFAESNGLDRSPPSLQELKTLCATLIDRANSLRDDVDEDAEGVMLLGTTRDGALARARQGYTRAAEVYDCLGACRPGKPKGVFLSPLLSYLGISGIYSPFTGEPNVDMEVPAYEFAFTVCHELAHQIGFAFEDEANFLGYLACTMHPDADFQYSGALKALSYAMNSLCVEDGRAYAELYKTCCDDIKRDWRAARVFWHIHDTPLRDFSAGVNDIYLKAQGEAEGIRSYGKVVDLLIAELRTRVREAGRIE